MPTDFPNRRPIQTVISFSGDGKMKPLYLCIDGVTLKVTSSKQFVKYGSSIFVCSVIDGDVLKEVQVYYHVRDNVWTIPK